MIEKQQFLKKFLHTQKYDKQYDNGFTSSKRSTLDGFICTIIIWKILF